MYHNSDLVVNFKKLPEDQHPNYRILKQTKQKKKPEDLMPIPIKTSGSYIQQPIIKQCLSNKNNIKRFVFKSKVHHCPNNQKLHSDVDLNGTMKILNLCDFQQKSKKFIRRYIRIDIRNYLRRKYNKPSYLLPLESFQCLRMTKLQNKNNQNQNQNTKKDKNKESKKQEDDINHKNMFRTDILYLYKPYMIMNIKQAVDKYSEMKNQSSQQKKQSQQQLKKQYNIQQQNIQQQNQKKSKKRTHRMILEYFKLENLSKTALKIISCVIIHGGLDHIFLTSSNLYFDFDLNDNNIIINHTSIAGILLVNCQKQISPLQLYQIFCYLTPYILKNGTQIKSKNQQSADQNWREIRYFKIRCVVINILCTIIKTDIYFQIIGLPNQPITWKQVLKIFQNFGMSSKFQKFLKKSNVIQSILKLDLQLRKQNRKTTQKTLLSLFQRVLVMEDKSISWEQVIEFFIQKFKPLDFSINTKPFKYSEYSQNIQQFHKIILSDDSNKQFYESRFLNGVHLYLPIKYDKNISDLLDNYWQWWTFLIMKTNQTKNQYIPSVFVYHETFASLILNEILQLNQPKESRQTLEIFQSLAYLSHSLGNKTSLQYQLDSQGMEQEIYKLKKYLFEIVNNFFQKSSKISQEQDYDDQAEYVVDAHLQNITINKNVNPQ